MAVMFQKMVMAGVGLICGSLALDLRRHKLVKEIVGYGRGEGNLRLAKKNGIIDSYFLDGEEFPAGVDFLMMGTPVETIVPLTKTFLPKLEPGCIISDVGSVKGEIVRGMERLLPKDIYFVAGHPIAGSEQWGAQAARRGLFVAPSLYSHADPSDRSAGAGKNRGALEKSRRRSRNHGSTHARSSAWRDQSFTPCFGVCFGERPRTHAAARYRAKEILRRRF